MSTYKSKYVVCPFYKKHENNHIVCEGTESSNTIHLTFGAKENAISYTKRYCNNIERYKHCCICTMLMMKYDE